MMLDFVKSQAKAMLYIHIGETEFSPVIVTHPFTNTGYIYMPINDNKHDMLNLFNKDDLILWRNYMQQKIDEAKTIYDIYYMINKPYRMFFVYYCRTSMDPKDFGNLLSNAWITSEAPNQDINVNKEKILNMFKSAKPEYLMETKELEKFNSFQYHDTLLIYRGVTDINQTHNALSWTLDYHVAEWFANRFNSNGTIYVASISPKYVYAYFNGRNEKEVIIDPEYLKNLATI